MPTPATKNDLPPGIELRHVIQLDENPAFAVALSPDGRTLASATEKGTIELWDAASGQRLRSLKGHSGIAYGVAWSPDGRTLASATEKGTIALWDAASGQRLRSLGGHSDTAYGVAWSPDGRTLASATEKGTIELWDAASGEHLRSLEGHSGSVLGVAWSPNGRTLASASEKATIALWDAASGERLRSLEGHSSFVYRVAWSPDGRTLASGSADRTVRIWDTETSQLLQILEGHASPISGIDYSSDGMLLAVQANGTWLWRCDTWEKASIIGPLDPQPYTILSGVSFPNASELLASVCLYDSTIRIWNVDIATLLGYAPAAPTVHYSNAKVVLVGDTGVGKSGLGLVLSGEDFIPTESTHGRRVWSLELQTVTLEDGRQESRETLLWDLAGQPAYRLIHQLHLGDVAVALVVFDARSEVDPFAGVRHWDRALNQARRVRGEDARPLRKFLVQARSDRGRVGVSATRLEALTRELGFDGHFETSAKEGRNIPELLAAVRDAIVWEVMPKVSSTELFRQIKAFLVREKESGRLLSTKADLYRAFLSSPGAPSETPELPAQYAACIGRVEAAGLIRGMGFGDLVLLQPELLDAYASAMVNAAKEEPDGLGCMVEDDARAGRFRIPTDERLPDRDRGQEALLLIATVEDLLRHEIALREPTPDGPHLVFPSQLTREHPDLPNPPGKEVAFRFDGPVQSVYATLAVRLSHSGVFRRAEMWQSAATYSATVGGTCGLVLRMIEDGTGELTLFFDAAASEETRFQFEQFVEAHLTRRALRETIQRRRIFVCPDPACAEPVAESAVGKRRGRGFAWMDCNVCGARIPLLDREERLAASRISRVSEMDRNADAQRDRASAASILQGKIMTDDFDVFLCHNTADKPAVKAIGERLREHGLLPWLDVEQLRPGLPWQRALEQQIQKVKAAAVFVGKKGFGPWQEQEQEALLREFVDRKCPVIPVILPDARRTKAPELPVFLKGMMWVDFRKLEPDPLQQLIWGITGEPKGMRF